jgi:hypothetical protein
MITTEVAKNASEGIEGRKQSRPVDRLKYLVGATVPNGGNQGDAVVLSCEQCFGENVRNGIYCPKPWLPIAM